MNLEPSGLQHGTTRKSCMSWRDTRLSWKQGSSFTVRYFQRCIVFIPHSDKLACEGMSIPGDWYEQCSLAFKFHACAYIIICVYLAELIIPCNSTIRAFRFWTGCWGKWVSTKSCGWPLVSCILFFAIVIMTTRTWAVWNRNRFLAYALPMFYFAIWAGALVLNAIFVQSLKC